MYSGSINLPRSGQATFMLRFWMRMREFMNEFAACQMIGEARPGELDDRRSNQSEGREGRMGCLGQA